MVEALEATLEIHEALVWSCQCQWKFQVEDNVKSDLGSLRHLNLGATLNNKFSSFNKSPKELEDNTKSDDSSGRTVDSPSQMENMGDTSSSNHLTEIQFNSLNDPPQSTSVFDDGYCIYQTPIPSNFTPNSRTFSAMAQDGRNLPSENQYPHPFSYKPVLVPGTIINYFPCWLPSWGGWVASWVSWLSLGWICQWPSFL